MRLYFFGFTSFNYSEEEDDYFLYFFLFTLVGVTFLPLPFILPLLFFFSLIADLLLFLLLLLLLLFYFLVLVSLFRRVEKTPISASVISTIEAELSSTSSVNFDIFETVCKMMDLYTLVTMFIF